MNRVGRPSLPHFPPTLFQSFAAPRAEGAQRPTCPDKRQRVCDGSTSLFVYVADWLKEQGGVLSKHRLM